jgi:protein-disulfide isomerase
MRWMARSGRAYGLPKVGSGLSAFRTPGARSLDLAHGDLVRTRSKGWGRSRQAKGSKPYAARRAPPMEKVFPELVLPVEERDHLLGPRSARYQLVEYGDYESSACRLAMATVREIVRELGDDLCVAFRNFPQPKRHPRSQAAAEAAESAGFQGKFWLMHDRLLDHQGELDDHRLREIAFSLPVDMSVFERDLASGEAARRVAEDVEMADEDGVGDTPTFFVNGTLQVGEYEFLPLLDALRKAPPR